MSDIELISPYSSRILRIDRWYKGETAFQHPYRDVEDFPDSWEPAFKSDDDMIRDLPLGEYCYTTNGIYRRWRTLQLTGESDE